MKESVKKFFRFLNLRKRYQQEQVHKRVMYLLGVHRSIQAAGLSSRFGGQNEVIRNLKLLARAVAEKDDASKKTFHEIAVMHYSLLCSSSGNSPPSDKFIATELLELVLRLSQEMQEDILNLFLQLGLATHVSKLLEKTGGRLSYKESVALAGTILCNKDSTEAVFLIQKIGDMSQDCSAITNVCSILRYVEKPSPEIATSGAEDTHMGGKGSSM